MVIPSMLTWLHRSRVRHYLRNSLWIFPVLAMVVAILLARVCHRLEASHGWESSFDPDTMRAVLGTLAGAMFTFIVFICSSLLLVVQLASAQLTPRIIAILFQDSVTKLTLSLFVFTFAFTISTMLSIKTSVPLLTAEIAAWSSAVCLCVFLYLIDHVGKFLRPSGALQSVASRAHRVIESVYPVRFRDSQESLVALAPPQHSATVTVSSSRDGVVLAFDEKGVLALATRFDCVIELAPRVGTYVAPGDALFRVYGGARVPVKVLRQSISLGAERTMEQDPMFAFRIIVDIASKGLSPAINDPTTAVLAIDRLHHLLRHVGSRHLDKEQVRDTAGRVRLIYRTPNWDDFVRLAVTEIRQFGSSSVQVMRRLRAMLEKLIKTLPKEREAALQQELKLLKLSATRVFQEPEDRALAEVSDEQGVGASRSSDSATSDLASK
jgi:uncharacterized membrane protein